jgi:hypothetical protein
MAEQLRKARASLGGLAGPHDPRSPRPHRLAGLHVEKEVRPSAANLIEAGDLIAILQAKARAPFYRRGDVSLPPGARARGP